MIIMENSRFRSFIRDLETWCHKEFPDNAPLSGENRFLVTLSESMKTVFGVDIELTEAKNRCEMDDNWAVFMAEFRQLNLPYIINEKMYKSDEKDITVIWLERNMDICHDPVVSYEFLYRYLQDINGETFSYFNEGKELEIISHLYNYRYGCFYKKIPNHIYCINELNVLFQHQRIPYQFLSQPIIGKSGNVYNGFQLQEVNW